MAQKSLLLCHLDRKGVFMSEKGAAGWMFLWLLGIPMPILLFFFLVRGCT